MIYHFAIGTQSKIIEKVEVYDLQGIHKFVLEGGILIPDVDTEREVFEVPYVTVTDKEGGAAGLNWEKIPLIPLKYNEQESSFLVSITNAFPNR